MFTFTKVFLGGSNEGMGETARLCFEEEMNEWFKRTRSVKNFNLRFVKYTGACDSIGTAFLSTLVVYEAMYEVE